MRTRRFITHVSFLLCTLFGCAAQTVDKTSAAPEASPSVMSTGLQARPVNRNCIAGPAAQVPQKLSQLGCSDAANPSLPGPGLVPYDVNAPLWTDDADKRRWLAIPDGTTITIDAEGHFVMPKGAVLLKTFARAGQLLETRVWMNHPDAGWLGYSYRWSADGSDAVLAADAGEQMPIGAGAELWTIPARGQCGQCHQPGANRNLGLQVAQLDRDFTYPSTGLTANQLDTLTAVGLLAPQVKPPVPSTQPKLVDYRDVSQPVESRARAYLHANCSSCHNAAEGYCTGDLRIGTTDAKMGVCDKTPKDLGERWGWLPNTKLVAPGDPERSALWLRLSAPGGADMAMPPLGRHEVHQEGVELIAAWISGLRGCDQ